MGRWYGGNFARDISLRKKEKMADQSGKVAALSCLCPKPMSGLIQQRSPEKDRDPMVLGILLGGDQWLSNTGHAANFKLW